MERANNVQGLVFKWDVHCIVRALMVRFYKQWRTIAIRCGVRTSEGDGTYTDPNAKRKNLRLEHMDVMNVEMLAVHPHVYYRCNVVLASN